jgi:YfiH family protein
VDWAGGLADADAVFTRVRGLPLAIGHADCLAVVLVDTEAGLLGLAHTGWRGALAGLPGKLAGRLVAEGAQAQRLRAFLSPCLGPAHLELGEEQYRAFLAADPKARNYLSRLEKGRFFLDLWTCARCHLEGAGLAGTHIQGQEMDTWSHPELFFSYRRDYGKTGRMLTAAWLD